MNTKTVRVLVVDADPSGEASIRALLGQVEGIEIVGIAHSKRAALKQVEETRPELMLVDLMLPGYRSIDLISQVRGTHPEINFLVISPGDTPYDRIIMAIRAGALGFITRDTDFDDISAAFQAVQQGEQWLPLEDTYDVLGEAAEELSETTQKRRGNLGQVLVGVISLSGMLAAISGFLWRHYWGEIGVRVVDLGVDPTTRMFDVFASLLIIIGIFGPLMFVKTWVEAAGGWIEKEHPSIAAWVVKARRRHSGRLFINNWVARILLAFLLLSSLFALTRFMPLILIVLVGPTVAVILLANMLDLGQELPTVLQLPEQRASKVILFLAVVVIVFVLIMGVEVWVLGPDLQADGLHGYLAPEVLDFGAQPVLIHDLDGNLEPLGVLYLGGNADLYVLYDVCTENVRFVPVGSSRVEFIDEITCP
jgi:DNA-binding NarL/FixJ family response regulator